MILSIMYKVAALYVPPFYTSLGRYDCVNEATFKHALEISVNLCKVITEVLTLFSLIPLKYGGAYTLTNRALARNIWPRHWDAPAMLSKDF